MEPVEEDVMKSKPKRKNEGIFANGLGYRVILCRESCSFSNSDWVFDWLEEYRRYCCRQNNGLCYTFDPDLSFFNMRSNHSLLKPVSFPMSSIFFATVVSLAMVAFCFYVIDPVARILQASRNA